MTLALAQPMADPKVLKQFNADFEIARTTLPRALRFIAAERQRQDALRTMKATRLAATEAGRALKRMHDDKSYADSYPNWSAVCKALNLVVRESYFLMDIPDVLDSIKGTSLGADGVNWRQSKVLAKIHPEDRASVVQHAEAAGDTSPGALKEWGQSLGSRARAAGRTEAEAKPQKKDRASGGLQRVKALISSALAVEIPEEAPPQLAAKLREHLEEAQAAAEAISAALAPV